MDENGPAKILVVDDESNILSSLKRLFKKNGFEIDSFTNAKQATQAELDQYDVIISDMQMPGMNGAQFLEFAYNHAPKSVRILLTGHADVNAAIEAINRGQIFRYINKPWDDNDFIATIKSALHMKELEEQKERLQEETNRKNEELTKLKESLEERVTERTKELGDAYQAMKENYSNTIRAFSAIISLRIDHHAKNYHKYTTDYARRLAIWKKLTDQQVQDITFASLLRDIGKLSLPDRLIHTNLSMLKKEERAEYNKHPIVGEALLSVLPPLKEAAKIIGSQLELYSGHGLPHKKSGKAIPLGARILTISTDYVLIRTSGINNKLLSKKEAIAYLRKHEIERYDPEMLDSFISMLLHEKADPLDIKRGRKIASTSLHPGMHLAEALHSKSGTIILKKGTILNAPEIKKIKDYEKQFYHSLAIVIE